MNVSELETDVMYWRYELHEALTRDATIKAWMVYRRDHSWIGDSVEIHTAPGVERPVMAGVTWGDKLDAVNGDLYFVVEGD